MMGNIPVEEMVRVFTDEIANGTEYTRSGDTYCCYQEITTASRWRFKLFIDCGELDYVAVAYAPDGRMATASDWPIDGALSDYDPLIWLESNAPDVYRILESKLLDAPIYVGR